MAWRSRFTVSAADQVEIWRVVARHRDAAGDTEGADRARWQARSIRSTYPVTRKAAP